jgi:hypothetical protein
VILLRWVRRNLRRDADGEYSGQPWSDAYGLAGGAHFEIVGNNVEIRLLKIYKSGQENTYS